MTTGKLIRLLLGISLAALFTWLLARHLNAADIRRAISSADAKWIIIAVAAFSLGYACRIERWRLMLKHSNPNLTWRACAGPFLASFAVNNILPFRAGDVLRSFAFNSTLGTTAGVIVATLFVERLLDLLIILLIFGTALTSFGVDAGPFSGIGSALLFTVSAAVLLTLLCPGLLSPVAAIAVRVTSRLSPRFGSRLSTEISKGLATLRYLAGRSATVKLLGWSFLAWLAEGCLFWFVALSLPHIAAPIAAWVALPTGTLATLVPSTPGYVGTFDYFVARSMTEFGNPALAATAYALLVHVLVWLPPTIIGGVYLLTHPIKLQNRTVEP